MLRSLAVSLSLGQLMINFATSCFPYSANKPCTCWMPGSQLRASFPITLWWEPHSSPRRRVQWLAPSYQRGKYGTEAKITCLRPHCLKPSSGILALEHHPQSLPSRAASRPEGGHCCALFSTVQNHLTDDRMSLSTQRVTLGTVRWGVPVIQHSGCSVQRTADLRPARVTVRLCL